MDNKYSHKYLLQEMQNIADDHNAERQDLFAPLLQARKVLTSKCSDDVFDQWLQNMQELFGKLDDDERVVMYKVLAVIACKNSDDIKSKYGLYEDDLIRKLNLDINTFYTYFYDDEMMAYANMSRIVELNQKRIRSLREIAESEKESGSVRIKAWDAIMSGIKDPAQPLPINVYSGQTVISNQPLPKSPNWSKLEGYGDESFRKRLRSKEKGKEELEEIQTIESSD